MNTNWIDKKFIQQLSYRLRNFREISSNPYKVNFSCPYCGDSKKNPNLGRAYLTEKEDVIYFKCFNCSHSTNSYKLSQFLDTNVYDEFIVEKFLEKDKSAGDDYVPILRKKEEKPKRNNPLIGLKKVIDLKPDHPVLEYLEKRKLPKDQLGRLYYTPKFRRWVNSVIPDYFENTKYDEPRLVIPFWTKDHSEIFAVSARSFDPKSLRYITIKFDDDQPKLFGLEQINTSKDIFVTEGPLDSLFLKNAVSFAGTDGVIDKYLPKEKLVIVLDNEPRNSEVIKKYRKFIEAGFRIVIWPQSFYGKGKDINDYVINGLTPDELIDIIKSNTFSGLEAEINFSSWKKI